MFEHKGWRVGEFASVSIGCSSCGILGLAEEQAILAAPVHSSPLLWCFYARRNVVCVLAASFAMEIITHSSILSKGHCSSLTSCFMCCFALPDN